MEQGSQKPEADSSENESISKTAKVDSLAPVIPTGSIERESRKPLTWLNSIHRSSLDIWLGGVCGGLGETTPMPSWCWRSLFLGFTLFGGVALLPYIVLWICMPADKNLRELNDNKIEKTSIDLATKKALTLTISSVVFLVAVLTISPFVFSGLSTLWGLIVMAILVPVVLLLFFIIRALGNKRVLLLQTRIRQLEGDLAEAQHRVHELEVSAEFLNKLQSSTTNSSSDEFR